MSKVIGPEEREAWQIPNFSLAIWTGKKRPYCVVIPVINEGERIASLLSRMNECKVHTHADIIIVDGGSTDGSLEPELLKAENVSGLLTKTGPGKLSAQLRCGYAFALDEEYEGIITIDGNDKDDPAAIDSFIQALKSGADFVQGSRFVPGGVAENTPPLRHLAVRYMHAPLMAFFSGKNWTDTTQGFRAYSRRLLTDPRVGAFRDIFSTYELLAYLSYRAPRLGFTCLELPTTRRYPKGEIPTKISHIRGNWSVFYTLVRACSGRFNP